MSQSIYVIAGLLSLTLGAIGLFLPVVPTTPFVILAAFCFSRSSPRLHQKLREHQTFGKSLRDWEDSGVIRLRAKLLATVMLAASGFTTVFLVALPGYVKAFVACCIGGVLLFIWTRPSNPAVRQ